MGHKSKRVAILPCIKNDASGVPAFNPHDGRPSVVPALPQAAWLIFAAIKPSRLTCVAGRTITGSRHAARPIPTSGQLRSDQAGRQKDYKHHSNIDRRVWPKIPPNNCC
jgi:hypothetical protein